MGCSSAALPSHCLPRYLTPQPPWAYLCQLLAILRRLHARQQLLRLEPRLAIRQHQLPVERRRARVGLRQRLVGGRQPRGQRVNLALRVLQDSIRYAHHKLQALMKNKAG